MLIALGDLQKRINRHRVRVRKAYDVMKLKDLTPLDVCEVATLVNRLNERFKPVEPQKCRLNHYAEYPPYNLDLVNSCIADIADYLGLTGLTFVAEFQEMDMDTAGRINMVERNGCVTVQLAPRLLDRGVALVGALCHEVMHKFLEKVDLTDPIAAVNEKMTDVSCVFFGMGQLLMSGCIWYEEHDEGGNSYFRTVCRTARRLGYLLPSQLALAYDLCVQRLGRKLNDSPNELKGMALAIFERYREEMAKIAQS